jgi:hypothetical protein
MRAVERFERTLPTAVQLLENGGRIALMIGAAQTGQANELAGELEWQHPVQLPGSQSRILLLGTKKVKVE